MTSSSDSVNRALGTNRALSERIPASGSRNAGFEYVRWRILVSRVDRRYWLSSQSQVPHIPGPTCFWPKESLGESPMPRLILSPCEPKGPKTLTVPVDPKLLEAGDHKRLDLLPAWTLCPGNSRRTVRWGLPAGWPQGSADWTGSTPFHRNWKSDRPHLWWVQNLLKHL